MGIVRVIKQNELQGGSSDEHIYPVTSVEAIYDLNNKKLSVSLSEITSNVVDLNNNVVQLAKNTNNIEKHLAQNDASIQSIHNNLESFKETITPEINNIKNTNISFQGIISGALEADRAAQNAQHNFKCSSSFNTETVDCEIFNVDNAKPGEAWFITKPGEYMINGDKYKVTNLSILQCVNSSSENKTFSVYDLGIPFIPIPTEDDAGKSLKVALDKSLYWD